MAKYCSVCGKKLGLLDGKIKIADGTVCTSCWASASLDMSFKTLLTAMNKKVKQLKDMIEIEVLKREAEKAGLKQSIEEKIKRLENKSTAESKAIDIIIKVDKNNNVDFMCEGRSVINFNDLINGKEMIIGDGFIKNELTSALPEVRIVCEFEPAIIDPGYIHYKAGRFKAGIEEQFEIDDPPVNLEEYSKIKRTRNGKVTFTLFIGKEKSSSVECELQIRPAPEEEMKKLMNAVLHEKEKNAPGPVNVFLYARENGAYEIDFIRHPELLYSMYSNGKEQLIDDVIIVNESGKALKRVQFEAEFTTDILSPVSALLGDVPAGEKIVFGVDDPAIDIEKLEMLTEIETCTAIYRLLVDGKPVAEANGRITVCPYDQWNAARILLPAYMTPNHPNIISVLQNASKWMLVNGMNPSLEGYQSDAKRVEEMIGAVYHAIKEANIVYTNPPASFFGPQRIRLCETVFEQKFATCMDMTILFASCLESFGLHPVLITAPRHILAGVWLTGKSKLSEAVLSDAKLIQKYIEDGQLVAVECTAMTAGQDKNYEEAKNMADKVIKAIVDNNIKDHECIDVQIARAIGVRPLPMRVHHQTPAENIEHKSEEPESSEKKTSASESLEPSKPALYTKEDYNEFTGDLSHISIENFYEKQSKRVIKDAIAEIVAVEEPISQPALIRNLIGATSLSRTGNKIIEYLDKLISTAEVKITRQSGVRFLWSRETEPAEYLTYRFKERRNPNDICKYELKNAVCYLIQENGPMTKEEITEKMTAMFGYSRSSQKIVDGANAAIKAAKELEAIEQNDEKQFILVE